MAHALSNSDKQQFIDRSGSYSTHGSRRGFVDIDLPMPEDQLADASNEWLVLSERKQTMTLQLSEYRKKLGIGAGKQLKKYENAARSGVYKNSKNLSDLLLEAMELAKECAALELRMKEVKLRMPKEPPRADAARFIDAARELLPSHLYQAIWVRAAEINNNTN